MAGLSFCREPDSSRPRDQSYDLFSKRFLFAFFQIKDLFSAAWFIRAIISVFKINIQIILDYLNIIFDILPD